MELFFRYYFSVYIVFVWEKCVCMYVYIDVCVKFCDRFWRDIQENNCLYEEKIGVQEQLLRERIDIFFSFLYFLNLVLYVLVFIK